LINESPVDVLGSGGVLIVDTTSATIVLSAVSTSDEGPLAVGCEHEINDDTWVCAQLEGQGVHVLAVDVSFMDLKGVVSYKI
jgi:hypothetical protein